MVEMKRHQKIFGHHLSSFGDALQEVLDFQKDHSIVPDRYGVSPFIESFQNEIAELCGFEAGLFMPTGTMAQQIALRIYADWKNNTHVTFHKTSHLELHEHQSYKHLHHLKAHLLGEYQKVLCQEDLKDLPPISAFLLELPQREIGGDLPSWEEWQGIKANIVKEKEAYLHLDGARLWECQPYYQKSYSEICEGFHSAYVSFYKGLGALGGAMLLGDKKFIKEADVWMRRHGGKLYQFFPYVISAKINFDKRISKIPHYHQKAKSVFEEIIKSVDLSKGGFAFNPDTPKVNFFHIHSHLPQEKMNAALKSYAETSGFQPFLAFMTSYRDGYESFAEFTVGDNTLPFSDQEVVAHFKKFFDYANSYSKT
jgi:threonine aldolase